MGDRSGRRAPLSRSLLLAGGALIALALVELLARAFLPPPPSVLFEETPPTAPVTDGNGASPESRLYVTTPTGLRLRPDARVVITARITKKPVEIRTNELGFRGSPIGRENARRILFLGDSITAADYLPEEETFVYRVGELGRAHGDEWETINAGVGSIGLQDEMAILREKGLSIAPDVVVLCFYLNDFDRSPGVYLPAIPVWLRWSRLAGHVAAAIALLSPSIGARSLEPVEIEKLRDEWVKDFPTGKGDYRVDRAAFNKVLYDWFFDFGGAWCPKLWTWMNPLFEEYRRLARDHAFVPIVVMFPVRHQVEAEFPTDEPQRRMRVVAARFGFPLLDLLPVFRAAYRSSAEPLFYDHCHPTPYGSRLVADEIYRFVTQAPLTAQRLANRR